MLKFIQQLPYRLTGTQADILSKYDANSRNKVSILGTLVLIPIFVWFITGFLLTYNIMHIGFFTSLAVAIGMSILVLIIERSIVMSSNVSKGVAIFRFLLATVLALLGSTVVDVCIFQNDINYKLKEQALTTLEVKSREALLRMDAKSTKLHNEIHGKGVTKMKGFGKASENLRNELNQCTADYNTQNAELQSAKEVLKDQNHPKYHETMSLLGYDSFLKRIHVLHQLISEDVMMMAMFSLLLCFGFFIEIFPLVLKVKMPKTAYELDVEAQFVLLSSRRNRVLEQHRLYNGQTEGQKKASRFLNGGNNISNIL